MYNIIIIIKMNDINDIIGYFVPREMNLKNSLRTDGGQGIRKGFRNPKSFCGSMKQNDFSQ